MRFCFSFYEYVMDDALPWFENVLRVSYYFLRVSFNELLRFDELSRQFVNILCIFDNAL